ncbi:hypothetical protein SFRURICE_003974 [Spodoptera frugiperda]|nr:hypothetical protein SFRURICE_003974 [Spodoptera frugiperda]
MFVNAPTTQEKILMWGYVFIKKKICEYVSSVCSAQSLRGIFWVFVSAFAVHVSVWKLLKQISSYFGRSENRPRAPCPAKHLRPLDQRSSRLLSYV